MSEESNFFEEAYRLCVDRDPFISNTCKSLYERMLARYNQDGFSPRNGFNILYLFQSAIKLMLENRPDVLIGETAYPYECRPIRAVNWTIEADDSGKYSELWKKYVDIVNTDSVSGGSDFDVAYAISILSDVIGPYGIPKNRELESTNDEPDLDEWLAGFNRE